MFQSIIFEDEITLWWDKTEFARKTDEYKLYLDGQYCGNTDKTHYTFPNLQANRTYHVCIEAYIVGVLTAKNEYCLQTKKQKNRIDVTKPPYNAVGDGKTLCTAALQKAFEDCTKDDCIYFSSGVFLTGGLTVHGDTEIYIAEGATICGSESCSDYLPKIKSRFEGLERECYRSLINMGELNHANYDYICKNVVIRGKGAIIGGGKPLALSIVEREKQLLQAYLTENEEYVKTCENDDTIPGRARGRLISMHNCENVIISGLTLGYAAAWNIHFVYSKNIVTYGCKICSNARFNERGETVKDAVWNGDGWDPDSSENCVLFDTVFETQDDCIAIKSGKNPEGNVINRPTKNVYIFDCTTRAGYGCAIGSEMSGGVENVRIWDCDFTRPLYGVHIKANPKRGGYVRNVCVTDGKLSCFFARRVTTNNDGEAAKTLPKLSDYVLDGVTLTGNPAAHDYHLYLQGFDEGHKIKNVCVTDCTFLNLHEKNGIFVEETDPVYYKNVKRIRTND